MFVRSDSSELAEITISFGIFAVVVVSCKVGLEVILTANTSFLDEILVSMMEEVSLAGDVELVSNSLLEVLLADEESLAGVRSTFKLCPWLEERPFFDSPFCSPFFREGLLFTFDGADSRITCAFVPP